MDEMGHCRSPLGDGSAGKGLAELIGEVIAIASKDIVGGGRVLQRQAVEKVVDTERVVSTSHSDCRKIFSWLYLYLEIRIVAISTVSLYRVWGINVSAARGLTAKTPEVYFLL